MNHPTKQELIRIVEAFRSATLDLSRAWEQLGEHTVVDDILAEGYPFPNCFIETASAISEWCGNAAEQPRHLPLNTRRNMDRITPEVVEALTRLLDYTEEDEKNDYQEAAEFERGNHIYGDICFLRGWISSLNVYARRPIRGSKRP
jgi:hypothetical protein